MQFKNEAKLSTVIGLKLYFVCEIQVMINVVNNFDTFAVVDKSINSLEIQSFNFTPMSVRLYFNFNLV